MRDSLLINKNYKGARNGQDFLTKIKEDPPNIWYQGEQIVNLVDFSPLKNGVLTIANLYDHQWTHSRIMLEEIDEKKYNRSFSIIRDKSQLITLGNSLIQGSRFSNGMLGREPAYLNRSLAAFAGSADFFNSGGSLFSENVKNVFSFIRGNDLCLTHTFLNPRVNRRFGPALQNDPTIAAHITKENDAGFFVSGARLVASLPFADELAVFPARLMDMTDESKNYAFAFVIPTSSNGLKFICRESVDYGLGRKSHPLSSRYEEMDSVAIFENVFVPWERVFCYRDIEICNQFYDRTGATSHISYQVVCKNIVKIEFYLGLISLMIQGGGLEIFQHIHEKMAEIWVGLQAMKSFKASSEIGARPNEFGLLVPDEDPLEAAKFMFPKLYPRIVEIVQLIGASSLVTIPTVGEVNGPLREDIERYYQSARMDASDRIDLHRLAWDASMSAFAGRQVQYERFYFGDPVSMASRIFRSHKCTDLMERVEKFIQQE